MTSGHGSTERSLPDMAKAGGQTLFAMFLSLVMAKYCVVGSQQLTSKGNLDLPRAAIRTILDTFGKKKKKPSVHFSKICPEYIGVIYMLIISEQYNPQLGSTEGRS